MELEQWASIRWGGRDFASSCRPLPLLGMPRLQSCLPRDLHHSGLRCPEGFRLRDLMVRAAGGQFGAALIEGSAQFCQQFQPYPGLGAFFLAVGVMLIGTYRPANQVSLFQEDPCPVCWKRRHASHMLKTSGSPGIAWNTALQRNICVYTCINTHMYHIYIYMYAYVTDTYTHIYAYVYTYVYIYIKMCVYTQYKI